MWPGGPSRPFPIRPAAAFGPWLFSWSSTREIRKVLSETYVAASATTSPANTSSTIPTSSRPRKEWITGGSGPRRPDHIADAAHGLDQRWVAPVHLPPQVGDVGLEDAGITAEVVVPDVVQDLAPAQDPAGIDEQVAEEPVFGWRHLDRTPGTADLMSLVVQLEVGDGQGAALVVGAVAAEDDADARHQLLQAEGLGDVVVAADGQTVDLVLGRVSSGEEDGRHVAAGGGDPAQHLVAVDVRQHDVEDHQGGLEGVDLGDRLAPIERRLHR